MGLRRIGAGLILCAGAMAMGSDAERDGHGVPRSVRDAFADTCEIRGADLHVRARLMRPTVIDEGSRYPLVVFLHGFGERGEENWRQLLNGGPEMTDPDLRTRHPAFVLAPQCPDGIEPSTGTERAWVFRLAPGERPNLNLEKPPTTQLHFVHEMVGQVCRSEPIDPDRVYVVGLSMGGYAAWELALRHPETYAAAVPICGGGDTAHAERLAGMAIWAFHGADDEVVPPERSREIVAAINAAGGRAILTEYPGVGHGSWVPAFASREMWDWLFAQRRGD